MNLGYEIDDVEYALVNLVVRLAITPKFKSDLPEYKRRQLIAYEFIESPYAEKVYDEGYGLATQKEPTFVGPFNQRKYLSFCGQLRSAINEWRIAEKRNRIFERMSK